MSEEHVAMTAIFETHTNDLSAYLSRMADWVILLVWKAYRDNAVTKLTQLASSEGTDLRISDLGEKLCSYHPLLFRRDHENHGCIRLINTDLAKAISMKLAVPQ